jgi:hypothetical protein
MGKLDNTLGHLYQRGQRRQRRGFSNGTPSEILQFNGIELPAAQMRFTTGTDQTCPHFAVGWLLHPELVEVTKSIKSRFLVQNRYKNFLGENLMAKYLVDAK